jgi:hypothetical protein
MSASDALATRPHRLFLSYAQRDHDVAERIARALDDANLRVSLEQVELAPGDSLLGRIDEALATSDFLLVLLSQHAVASRWMEYELDRFLVRQLNDRAITVIPALIGDCQIPASLARRRYVDLRHGGDDGLSELIAQLRVAPAINFAKLSPVTFEQLVVDLLKRLGFGVDAGRTERQRDVDIYATWAKHDPFGIEQKEYWLVETKLYKQGRVGVSALHQMFAFLNDWPPSTKGLLVTTTRLTSTARQSLVTFNEQFDRELRVIDQMELIELLMQYPDIVLKYFLRNPYD